ncbi:hypothetical protein HYR54_04785 [Candidatus Acetothermia bacterium]|nr:hypothetical protein [Candidatus Acetothermia bacterium]MBI3459625.1 hypothetical protein [Candidatus Acetothermia bacterium]MBI3659593.1 hypothetical protein [Candidatus Acetothermia bacterium]
MPKKPITLTLSDEVLEQLEMVAEHQKRSLSSQIDLALRDWLHLKEELHPQFMADIKEALRGVKRGQVEPIWKG